jgi:hypothetical protein
MTTLPAKRSLTRWHVLADDSSSGLPIAVCGRHLRSCVRREWLPPIEVACRYICPECLDTLIDEYRQPRQLELFPEPEVRKCVQLRAPVE